MTDLDLPQYSRKRKYRRYELRYPVRVRFPLGEAVSEFDALSKNVSVGGMLIQAAAPVPEHCSVTLTMTLHGRPIVRPIQLTAEGRVVRVVRDSPGFAIAVECSEPMTQLASALSASQA
jgi:hypothetical protein